MLENQLGRNCRIPPKNIAEYLNQEWQGGCKQKTDWVSGCKESLKTSEATFLSSYVHTTKRDKAGEGVFALDFKINIPIRQLEMWDWSTEEISRLKLWI